MKKLLVTTDGSKNSKKALLEAKRLATALDLKIIILNVVNDIVITPYMTMQYNMIQQSDKDLRQIGEKILEESLKLFDDFEGEIETKLERGDPADIIIKEVKDNDYELIVMGSRGLGTFSRAMLGSVSSRVLHHVKTNIFIVK
nr:universal stress protein [Tissierella sp.]